MRSKVETEICFRVLKHGRPSRSRRQKPQAPSVKEPLGREWKIFLNNTHNRQVIARYSYQYLGVLITLTSQSYL